MFSLALVVVLLAAAASYGSWQFAQSTGARQRAPAATLLLCGIVFLTAFVMLAIVTATSWWQPLASIKDLSVPPLAPAVSAQHEARTPAAPHADSSDADKVSKRVALLLKDAQGAMQVKDWSAALAFLVQAQLVGDRSAYDDYKIAEFLVYVHIQLREFKEAALALEQQLKWPRLEPDQRLALLRTGALLNYQIKDYAKSIAFGTEYLGKHSQDAQIRVLVAQSLYFHRDYGEAEKQIDAAIASNVAMGSDVPEHWVQLRLSSASRSGDAGVSAADPLLKDWPATGCVKAGRTHNDSVGQPFIDNDCERVVAVIFAWCQQTQAACTSLPAVSQGWRYEPAGILMTSTAQRPSSLRLGEKGPLVAATYVLSQPGDQRRRVRYLACYVTAPEVLSFLGGSNDAASPESQRRELESVLSRDDCYSRVAQLSLAGQREGMSPDALLSDGD